MKATRTTLLLATCALAGSLSAGRAPTVRDEGWKPWQFGTNELYELRMVDRSDAAATPVGLVLDIRPEAAKDGLDQVSVSYTTRVQMPASELGPQTAFGGAFAGIGLGPAMLLMNPMMVGFMDQVELKVGEKMALFGAGRIEVTGTKEIAGYEGFVCKFFGPKQQNEPLQFECTVHPDLAIPLESITYDTSGQTTWEIQLVRYEKR